MHIENVAKSINLCYTYDELSRVTVTEKCDNGAPVSTESFTYDEAGNILSSVDGNGSISQVSYDTNNRITYFNGWDVWYDMDGNQRQLPLCNEHSHLEYDSKNRLISTGSISYSYNAEDYRTSKVRYGIETRYTYNTNSKLSQLMVETRDGVDIKCVYGMELVGREKDGVFNYYHFDCKKIIRVSIIWRVVRIVCFFEYFIVSKLICVQKHGITLLITCAR